MDIIVVGVNHKTTPIEIREKLAFSSKDIELSFSNLKDDNELPEKVILSTCNRVEVYARAANIDTGISKIREFLHIHHNIEKGVLDKCIYSYSSYDAIKHLFAVSSSLDSMVVGEPQILGQVKEAYRCAKSFNATGYILNQLFERAFTVAKKVRTDTAIAENPVSISYAAVELAKKIFGSLEGKTVLLIGAGEMSELAARHLVASGVKAVWVSNRTFERAVDLAKEFNGNAVRFENLHEEIRHADIVISSTGAPHYIIKKAMVEQIIHIRKNRPMFFIDIAVPRDIDPYINDIENIYLYDIDDLQNVIDANMKEREKEAKKAEEIVRREVDNFINWLNTLDIVPTISHIRKQADDIRVKELSKTLARLGTISDEHRDAIDALTASIVNKMLHHPTVNLKKQAEAKNGDQYLRVVKDLFNIDKGG